MPEPVTLAALAVGAIGAVAGNPIMQNVVGNRADALLTALGGAVKERIGGQDGSLPNNHDVERAIRMAHVQALRAITATYLAGAPKEVERRAFSRRMNAWLDRQVTLTKVDADWPATATLVENVDAVLARTKSTSAASLRAAAEHAAWNELDLWTRADASTTAPEDFRALFFLEEAGWYAAFGAFVAEGIKDNERFRSVFTAAKLSEIAGAIEQYATEGAKVAKSLAAQIAQVQRKLDEIGEDTDAILAGVTDIKELLSRISGPQPAEATKSGSDHRRARSEVSADRSETLADVSVQGHWKIRARHEHATPLGRAVMFLKHDVVLFPKSGGTMKWSLSDGTLTVLTEKTMPAPPEVGLLGFVGRHLLFGDESGDISIHTFGESFLAEGEPTHLKAHKARPVFIGVSADGSRLLSIDARGHAFVWDWIERSLVCGFRALATPTASGYFSNQSSKIALISQSGEIEIFDAATGKALGQVDANIAGLGCSARFSLDDKYIVARDESDRWDIFDAQNYHRIDRAAWRTVVVEAGVSKSGTTILYYTADGVIGFGAMDSASPKHLLATDVFPPVERRAEASSMSDDGNLVAILRGQKVDVWERIGP